MLTQFELEIGAQPRAVGIERAIRADTTVVESDQNICPRLESLLIAEISRGRCLARSGRTRKDVICNRIVVVELQRSGKNRVKTRDKRSKTFRTGYSQRPGASSTGPCAGSTRS